MLATRCAVSAAQDEPLRSSAEVDALPTGSLASRPTATLRGQIIARSSGDDGPEAILEDQQGGIRIVGIDDARPEGTGGSDAGLLPGDVVEVQGRIEADHRGRVLRSTRIVRLGTEPLPTPRLCDVTAFFSGREDCRLVAVEGIVERAWHDGAEVLLEIHTAGRLFTATVPADVVTAIPEIRDDPLPLVDAVVRVAGPATSDANARGEPARPRIHVERPDWLTIVEPAATGIDFSRVAVSLDAIGRARSPRPAGHRVYTHGQVIYAVPGQRLFLQNGHHGLEVRLAKGTVGSAERFMAGDRVEVAGFVDRSGPVASMRNASVRRITAGEPPMPLMATPDLILAAHGGAASAEIQAAPGDYQGCLVRCVGALVQPQAGNAGGMLLVDCGGMVVPVEADAATFATLAGTPPRSRLAVTGVAVIDRDRPAGGLALTTPPRLRLLLRSADDVQLLESPPWWTASRLWVLLGATAAVLVAALVWAVALRRQLAVQTQRLAREMGSRRDAALEFEATLRERNRLAANLHDTLQQTIAGIGFQLDACTVAAADPEATAGRHLDVARRMVDHAAKELQGSVWTMRSLPLEGRPFRDALTALVFRVCEGHDVRLTVDAEGPLENLPEFVAGSVLLIVQEAVHNALKHASPMRIEVHVQAGVDDGPLVARVADDGVGFHVGSQPGPRQGHFGIQGMRERAERLGGRLVVRNRPGGGTIIEAHVQRRDYDPEIDAPAAG